MLFQKNANGKNLEIETTDGVKVNVALQEPITDNIEGLVELHGTLQSKSTMLANCCIHFPPEISKNMGKLNFLLDRNSIFQNFSPLTDVKMYNELLSIKNVLGKNQWILNENDNGL